MNGAAPRLRLSLIGRLAVTGDSREIEVLGRPALWLLGYLALCPGMRTDRTMVASQFWEDRPDARARQNLRQALFELRRALTACAPDTVRSSHNEIWLDNDAIATDVGDLMADLHRGEVPDQLLTQAVPGQVLSDLYPHGNLLASWLHLRRIEIENRLREGLTAILSAANLDTVIRAARALLTIDPSDENACRTLMRTTWQAGAPARALEAYAGLWNHLDEEYGIEPAPETQQLVAEIKLQADRPERTSPLAPAPAQRPRIRVQPFEMAASVPEGATVLRLFRTELISRLVRFREWQLFDGEFQSCNSDYELRLSGATVHGRISLVVVLTDVRDGQVVWGETSHALAEDWLDFHRRIARKLAASCNISVSFSRLTRLATRPAESAFDNWLLGQTRMLRFRKQDLDEAMRLYERATLQDPNFARAWSSQSQLLNIRHLCLPGTMRDGATVNRSLALANKAVSIDPADAQAHLCRGWACMHLREWAHAKVSFDLAQRCNADDPWAVVSIALAAAFRGEHELAAELTDRFLDEGWTNSAINWGYLSNIRFLAGDFKGAVAAAESAGAATLNIPAWHSAALANLGRQDEAAEKWQIFEDLVRPQWSGARPADTAAIREWLLAGFPIRGDAELQSLARGVKLAIARLGQRQAH